MWYPQKLLVTNLMSHELSGYEFENGRAVMIHGINNCDDEQESNGSGKSAILEGISMAMLGAPLRDASAKDLIKDGEDSCSVELQLFNTKTNQLMVIKRDFYANSKSAALEISFDGKVVGDMTSVRHGNEMILEAIGIAREDLLNYYLLSSEKYAPFLRMSDTKKKQMIGRFSQADLIDPAIESVDADIDKVTRLSERCQREIDRLEAKVEVYENEMSGIDLKVLKERRQRLIDECNTAWQSYNMEIEDLTEEIGKTKEKLKVAEKRVMDFVTIDFEKENEIISKKEKVFLQELEEAKADKDRLVELEARVNKSLAGAVQCPKCSHEFSVADEKISIAKARDQHGEIKKEISYIDSDLEAIKKDLRTKVDEKRKSLRSQENENMEKYRTLQREVKSLETRLEDLKRDRNRVCDRAAEKENEKEELKKAPIQDSSIEYKEKIERLKKDIDTAKEIFDENQEQIGELEELKATLVKFKTHLSNKAIGAIEAHANHHLEKTGTDISLQLDGYKMTKQKKIRENISATIFRDGEDKGVLGKFSGGEKARVEIALIIAPQQLINMNCDSGGLDLLFLDEVIEAVDSAGIGGIMESLNETGKTILVITHGTFNQNYPHIVEVEKQKNGVSVIKS